MSSVKNFSILEIALIFFRYDVVAMVTVINSMIGGFSWVDLVWLAASTVRLQPNVRLQLYRVICDI